MIDATQVAIYGALIGLVYGLIALSFVVVYRASQIVNIAQGEVLVVAAFLIWLFVTRLGLPMWQALPAAALACVVFGLLVERIAFRPLIGQSSFSIFMASVALLILLGGLTQAIFGAETRAFPEFLPSGAWVIGPFRVSKQLLIGAGVTIVLVEALNWFLLNTRFGLRLATVAEDHYVALSLGIPVRHAIATAWILGALLAGIGAIILLSGQILSPKAADIGFRALPIALLGGLESVRGALVAGLLIGIAGSLASAYLDPLTNGVASQVLPFAVMIAVLLVRPQGLYGWKVIERL